MFLLKKISLFLACLLVTSVQARVTKIQIDQIEQFTNEMSGGVATEQIAGRAFGELDPRLIQNSVINDIQYVKDADGKVRYVATFVITVLARFTPEQQRYMPFSGPSPENFRVLNYTYYSQTGSDGTSNLAETLKRWTAFRSK